MLWKVESGKWKVEAGMWNVEAGMDPTGEPSWLNSVALKMSRFAWAGL
jgi:hypothetical protein